MNLAAIYHRTSDNYCYALDDHQLIVNLKTGYDVAEVSIIYEDPYLGGISGGNWQWHGQRLAMPFKKELDNHQWWTTTITPSFKRCKYYFELTFTDGQHICFLENAFLSAEAVADHRTVKQMFTFPWLNSIDVNEVPQWVNSTVWYQIFPDRFNNSSTIKREGLTPWQHGAVSNAQIYGGDLQGIINKLDYLNELGINGLYMTPIFKARSIHKYDTTDYYEVDELFGDREKLRLLVDSAHQRGIKVMFDGVFNHTGTDFFAWKDIIEYGRKSVFFDWYMINNFPFGEEPHKTKHGDYYAFAFGDDMPKLNTNNPEVITYLVDVVKHWIKEFGIDGLRIDVANEVSHQFCKQLRREIKAMKSDFYILGEIWHDAMNWLRNDEFDSVMNYPLTGTISNFWLDNNMPRQRLYNQINKSYTMYMQQTNDVLFNLLDSHDTQRMFNRVGGNLDFFYQQLMLMFVMPGSPCIYYGTEIALEGEHDPDCRRCMPWDNIEAGYYDERIAMVKKIIALRKEQPCLRSRNFHFEQNSINNRVIELLKIADDGCTIKIWINASLYDEEFIGKDVLLSYKYENNILKPGGFLVDSLQTCN